MADELIDIYNEENESLGITKMKSEAHKDGLWHRAVHIWIYNSKGEILTQKRAPEKEPYPNLWDLAGAAGHVGAGEKEITSALRELEEEIGLFLAEDDLEFVGVKKHHAISGNVQNNEYRYVYIYKYEGSITDLKMQEEEVSEIQFRDLKEVREDLEKQPEKYLPKTTYWDDMFGEIEARL